MNETFTVNFFRAAARAAARTFTDFLWTGSKIRCKNAIGAAKTSPERAAGVVFAFASAYNGEMRFFAEIMKALGGEAGTGVQYTVLDGQGGYFQNIKKMELFTAEEIVFRGKKGAVRVEGRQLSLGKYGGGDATVRGEIVKVERI